MNTELHVEELARCLVRSAVAARRNIVSVLTGDDEHFTRADDRRRREAHSQYGHHGLLVSRLCCNAGSNAPLIHLLISALFISFVCLHRLLRYLSFFFTFSLLIYSLSYLFLLDPLRFKAGLLKLF